MSSEEDTESSKQDPDKTFVEDSSVVEGALKNVYKLARITHIESLPHFGDPLQCLVFLARVFYFLTYHDLPKYQ